MKAMMDSALGYVARIPELANYLDVTVLLARDVYGILPAALITAVTPIYLSTAFRSPRCPKSSKLLWSKIVIVATMLLLEAANVAMFSTTPAIRSKSTVAVAIASAVSTVCIALLLYAERAFSFRSPGFFSLGLAVTVLFDITKARSYLGQADYQNACNLSTALYLLKALLLLSEEAAKALALRSTRPRRIHKQNIVTRNLFLWLNATLIVGFRNVLRVNDLLDMGPKFNSELLYQRFKPIWGKGMPLR